MEWKVDNALNRHIERQQLNKILAEIKGTVGSTTTSTPAVNTTVQTTVVKTVVNPFQLTLTGAVSGSAQVTGTGDVTLDTAGVGEAPINNQFYVRYNASWVAQPPSDNSLTLGEVRRRVSMGW